MAAGSAPSTYPLNSASSGLPRQFTMRRMTSSDEKYTATVAYAARVRRGSRLKTRTLGKQRCTRSAARRAHRAQRRGAAGTKPPCGGDAVGRRAPRTRRRAGLAGWPKLARRRARTAGTSHRLSGSSPCTKSNCSAYASTACAFALSSSTAAILLVFAAPTQAPTRSRPPPPCANTERRGGTLCRRRPGDPQARPARGRADRRYDGSDASSPPNLRTAFAPALPADNTLSRRRRLQRARPR